MNGPLNLTDPVSSMGHEIERSVQCGTGYFRQGALVANSHVEASRSILFACSLPPPAAFIALKAVSPKHNFQLDSTEGGE